MVSNVIAQRPDLFCNNNRHNVACGKMSTFLLLMRHGLQAGEGFPAKPMAFPAQLVQVADTSPRLGQ
jgi:hypothetical protein